MLQYWKVSATQDDFVKFLGGVRQLFLRPGAPELCGWPEAWNWFAECYGEQIHEHERVKVQRQERQACLSQQADHKDLPTLDFAAQILLRHTVQAAQSWLVDPVAGRSQPRVEAGWTMLDVSLSPRMICLRAQMPRPSGNRDGRRG